jgi:hypothetical protein
MHDEGGNSQLARVGLEKINISVLSSGRSKVLFVCASAFEILKKVSL